MAYFTMSMRNLKKTAIYVGAASIMGSAFLANRIQRNFRNQEFHKKSMELLRGYPAAIKLLGQPIKSRRLDLGGTIENYTDGLNARLTIDVKGPAGQGKLHTWCSRFDAKDHWTVQKLDLEMNNNQWTFYLNPDSPDDIKPTVNQSQDIPSDDEVIGNYVNDDDISVSKPEDSLLYIDNKT